MKTQPSQDVLDAIARLHQALDGEDFNVMVLVAWPDLSYMATVTNMEKEKEVLALLKHAKQRVQSGAWRRERGEVHDGEPT